jgi:signal-transduction protein with cAMP-binding, CBS, and nucleotidyltransferase domain
MIIVMKTIGTIGNILHHKGGGIWAVAPDASVFDAIKLLAEKNIGALLVMSGENLVGIFSERDYTRNVALKGRNSKETRVREVVSGSVISVTPDHTIEECMRMMTEQRVRHLPVLEGNRVTGVISIGDLVNWIINSQSVALEQMESYITGGYPTGAHI